MERNACGLDRALRLIGAAAIAALALWTSGGVLDRDDDVAIWQILAMYAASELAVTGLTQWCPANYLLGRDTCADVRSRQVTLTDSVGKRERADQTLTDRVKATLPTV